MRHFGHYGFTQWHNAACARFLLLLRYDICCCCCLKRGTWHQPTSCVTADKTKQFNIILVFFFVNCR